MPDQDRQPVRIQGGCFCEVSVSCILQTWQRPTLPCLKTKYHWRRNVSRPSSEWDRVQAFRHNHQVGKKHKITEKLYILPIITVCTVFQSIYFTLRVSRIPGTWRLDSGNGNDQVDRTISTGKLHTLPYLHTRPINVVVFHGSQGNTRFQVGFPLRCLQRLSLPYIATLLCGWRHNRSTRDTSIPVLSY